MAAGVECVGQAGTGGFRNMDEDDHFLSQSSLSKTNAIDRPCLMLR
jgi:hypothetical protein